MLSLSRIRIIVLFVSLILILFMASSGFTQDDGSSIKAADSGPNSLKSESNSVEHLFWHADGEDSHHLGKSAINVTSLETLSVNKQFDAEQIAVAFLTEYRHQLGLGNSEDISWDKLRIQVEPDGFSTVVLQQVYKNIPVYGAQVAVHMENSLQISGANGEYGTQFQVNTQPKLSEKEAFENAAAHLEWENVESDKSELVILIPAIYYRGTSKDHLAYHFKLVSNDHVGLYEVFVDAHSGEILHSFEVVHEALNREIYDLDKSWSGNYQCLSESGPVGWESPSFDCKEAYINSGETYNYFYNTFGRDSFDDAGATMIAHVNLFYPNAYWDFEKTVYGTGFAKKDIVAHEWTHAITSYTADLIYYEQSGALNESMSDIFGAMVDREDWLVGEESIIGPIRSLSDPNAFGDPGKVSDSQYYCGYDDNSGVHTNSGVPNHAAYLMAEGGYYNGYSINGIGREPTEQIFYRALTHYLTRGSDFFDASNALNSACMDLYGNGSTVCGAVSDSLLAVEMAAPRCSISTITPDSFETDDEPNLASTIVVGGVSQTHNTHDLLDDDWMRFTAVANTVYEIETFNLGENSDTVITLYDSELNFIDYDDDSGEGYASRLIFRAPSSEDYFIQVNQWNYYYTYGLGTQYDISVVESDIELPKPDDYEPDDSSDEASLLNVGETQTHNTHDKGDIDWMRFTAVANTVYEIETFNLGENSDTVIALYDSELNNFDSDDDSGEEYASYLQFYAPSSGDYFIEVRQWNYNTYGPGTQYDITVAESDIEPPEGDVYEPDDSSEEASPLNVGDTQTHDTHYRGDADWIRFTAVANTVYEIETFNLRKNSDTVIALYDSDLNYIDSDDQSGEGDASYLQFYAPSSGDYFIEIKQWNYNTYGLGTQYDISVTESDIQPPEPDDYEPDNSSSEASLLNIGDTQTHDTHYKGDVDWIRFTAVFNKIYEIETFNLGENSDTVITLYDSELNFLDYDNQSGEGDASYLQFYAPSSGDYFIKVKQWDYYTYGPGTQYDISVVESDIESPKVDDYEPDNSSSEASLLYVGDTQTHDTHYKGDVDWIRFTAVANTVYEIETFALGENSDTIITLYDSELNYIDSDDRSGEGDASYLQFYAPSSGDYFVEVKQWDYYMYGPGTQYDVSVMEVEWLSTADSFEPDNSIQDASLFLGDAPQSHNFHEAFDEDWIEFNAKAGKIYLIETSDLGFRSDTVLEIYDVDLNLIDSNDDNGNTFASQIVWRAPADGLYFIAVRHYWGSYGAGTQYNITLSEIFLFYLPLVMHEN